VSDAKRFYDTMYGSAGADVRAKVRLETYTEDIGQAGWLFADEAREFVSWLGPDTGHILDVGCGSGGISAFLSRETGARVTGVDTNETAVAAARERGAERCEFHIADASARLLFDDGSFDAVFCNESIHHLADRDSVLRDWARLLRPGGRVVYTDPIVVTGYVTNEEVQGRTFMGLFLLSPPGANERSIERAGFVLERSEDRSSPVVLVAERSLAARERYRGELVSIEGEVPFETTQRFFDLARRLAAELRLSRWVFLLRKPESAESGTR
jgi:SAM-dependent methyltransferase